jgi:hypothetical protein
LRTDRGFGRVSIDILIARLFLFDFFGGTHDDSKPVSPGNGSGGIRGDG